MKLIPGLLENVSTTFTQDVDCCGEANELVNVIEIETHDGGGGSYIVLKTKRWALDVQDIDAFCAGLKKILAIIPSEADQVSKTDQDHGTQPSRFSKQLEI